MNNDKPDRELGTSEANNAEATPDALLAGDVDTEDVPKSKKTTRPIVVGIGASAGGLEALSTFFHALPPDTGLTFVVVTHLSPDHESILDTLLQRHTAMPVIQVQAERVRIAPNHVYVIPPNRQLVLTDHALRTGEFDSPRAGRAPIDIFFRSLAAVHAEPIAIVLSGGGSDGALGIRSVKEAGGIILVQEPQDAAHDSMPLAAIATGMVDFVLPARDLAQKLAAINRHRVRVPNDSQQLSPEQQDALQDILAQLQARTGHDFRAYKHSTILRRVQRRLQITGYETLEGYLPFLRQSADETQTLLRDLLIGVTNFFRDEQSWRMVAQDVVPKLFDERRPEDVIRVWSLGCSTGEEAYSMAIQLLEYAATLDAPPQLQVFATDMDAESLNKARDGLYPDTIAADVSTERLERFFIREGAYYQVRREVRDVVLFATHSVLRDPPFSRLDLIVCRNLLIYLQRPLQEKLFEIFYYALRPGAFLFLGSSESADSMEELFQTVDKKHRLYRRREWNGRSTALPALPLVAGSRRSPLPNRDTEPRPTDHSRLFRSSSQQTLEAFGPAMVLVDSEANIMRLSGMVGRYLHYPDGLPTYNINRVIRPELQFELRSTLSRVFASGQPMLSAPIRLTIDGEDRRVFLSVQPRVAPDEQSVALILIIEDQAGVMGNPPGGVHDVTGDDEATKRLLAEVEHLRERLQAAAEEYESSTEDLKAANEELQSINEEYRSTTEELETSKEELQSVNEELETVNNELKTSLEAMSRAHSDLQNLMAATEIATLFLDRDLGIKRFTAGVEGLFNIMPSDRGRPLTHLTHRLDYPELAADARLVLRTLVPTEREVRHTQNGWFLARIRPYRTIEDHIEGVVITFVDVSRLKATEQRLYDSQQLVTLALDAAGMGWGAWNLATGRAEVDARTRELLGFGPDRGEITLASWLERVEAEDRVALETAIRAGAESGDALDTIFRVMAGDGTWRHLHANGTFIIDNQSREPQLTSILRDETERLSNEQALNEARESLEARVAERTRELQAANAELTATRDRFTALFNTSPVPTVILDPNDGAYLDANPAFLDFLGMSREQIIGRLPADLFHTMPVYDDPDAINDEFARTGRVRDLKTTFTVRAGDERTILLSFVPLTLDGRDVLMSTLSDITERERNHSLIEQQQQSLAEANAELAAARDHFQTLFHANPVPSVILRIDDLVAIDANQAFLAFHDLSREDIIGRSVLDLVTLPSRDGRRDLALIYRRQGGLRNQELVLRLRNGQERTVLLSDTPIYLEGQRCTLATLIDITQRKQAEEQTRHFASQLSLAEQAERQRIADILHDDLQQRLFALQVRLASASAWVGQGEKGAAAAEVEQMRRTLTNAIDLTRRLTVDLSPPILHGEGLYHAIVWLGSRMKEEYGLELSVHLETTWQPLDQGMRVALFQIVRELLFNVVKHAGVGAATVTLSQVARDVTLVVRDDGVGFDTEQAITSGQGLRQARQRVELYGGHLTLDTRPGAGTTVTITVPLTL
jgi:two-component system CheB/CheR fusion protein